MSKENPMDLATDILKGRLADAFGELRTQFKGTNPYRQEPIPRKERLAQYESFTPEIEARMRESIGNEAVDKYMVKMEALKRQRYGRKEIGYDNANGVQADTTGRRKSVSMDTPGPTARY